MRMIVRMWRAGNGSRALVVSYVAFLFAMAAALAGVIVVATDSRSEPWDPLGAFPTQQVVTKRISLKDRDPHLIVVGTKCSRQNAVTVTGVTRWQSVDPPGTIVITSSATAVRAKGCTTRRFANPIPDTIVSIIRNGGPKHWILSGTETPIRRGSEGVPRAWQTEEFEVDP